MSDLNWNLREILHVFSDSRLPVFMSIYLHKNIRNRSWPSNELIHDETGLSSAPISKAIDWLITNQVVALVPFEKRVGLELKLPNRKNIYQLTGVVLIEGDYYPYMNLTPEGWESIADDLELMGNSLLSKQLTDVNSLLSKRLLSKRKGIKGISPKDIKKERVPPTNTLHPFIQVWVDVLGIDAVNIGAPVFTAKDLACAKRMAKWEVPPTDQEITAAIQASKAKNYRFDWLESDIPKVRLIQPKPFNESAPTSPPPIYKPSAKVQQREAEFQEWMKKGQPVNEEEF